MAIRTPEPRIPLEPEEYPLYKPPRRVGCSGLTVVALLALGAFAFLFLRVVPPMAKAITDFPRSLPIIGSGSTPVPDDTNPGTGGFPTQTALAVATTALAPGGSNSTPPAPAAVTNTAVPPTPAPTNTPTIQYVKVSGTGGQGVRVMKSGSADSARVGAIEESKVVKIVGPDVNDPKTSTLVWRHVQTLDGKIDGYVSAKYLISSSAPAP